MRLTYAACVCAAVFVAVLAVVADPVRADEQVASHPNLILVMTDDQGYGPIGRHGHPWIHTPNLDKLYDTSTRFTQFFVSPTCAPTRSALMTGRHPLENGVTHTLLERERLTLDAVTLPQVLKSAGYTTGIFGKWHLGDEDAYQPNRRGFDESFIHGCGGIGQVYECSCADAPGNTYFDPVIRHNGTFVKTRGFCTDVFFDAALGWIKSCHDQNRDGTGSPFFAYIATNAPHAPFTAPPRYAKRFEDLGFDKKSAGFYGMIENIDDNVGRLLARLEDWRLLDNTVLIFMSDNGMATVGNGDLKRPLGRLPDGTELKSYNAGMKGLKGSVDEGGVRVPYFVRWDGHFRPNRDVDRIAAHVDVLPTLADLAGGDLPQDQVEGRSLVPLLRDQQCDWNDRYFINHRGRWEPGANPDDFKWQNFAVRSQRFRLVGTDQLFDMENDPGQKHNVIGEHPDIAREMKNAYSKFWDKARPMMVNEDVPPSLTHPYYTEFSAQQKTQGIPDWVKPRL
jgi:arylsulfatase A-like enzyme